MSLSATIDAMIASGCSAEQIGAVARAYEAETEAKAEAKRASRRAGNAERQRRFRASSNADNGVTSRDEALCAVTERDKEKPHTPKENPPLPSPPKGGSVRPPAGGLDDPKTILSAVVSDRTAGELVAHRKALKSPLTGGSARGLAKQISQGDAEVNAAAMMANGWRGFKPEWMPGNQPRAGPSLFSNSDGRHELMREIEEAMNG